MIPLNMTMLHNQDFIIFLRMMSKKGFYTVLKFVNENGDVSYNQVLKFAIEKKVVDSKASITIILNGLTNLGLLERSVIDSRPLRTNYRVNENGHTVIKNFKELETLF